MQEIHYTCQGESHKATNKVCQDFSLVEISDSLSVAVVCDGHGGERYFRSDIGSKIAAEVTRDCLSQFTNGIDKSVFVGKPYTTHSALSTEVKNNDYHKETDIEKIMRQLFSSIIYNWREKILAHALANTLTEKEQSFAPDDAKQEFSQQVGLEKTYGCTLMCYAETPDYWLAFHIGDGKCVSFDEDGTWKEPIPWDDKCFLNKTTSLCDSSAIDEFRYCYEGDGLFPLAVFLGSDGIDDSFGETPNMINFYVQILKTLSNNTVKDAEQQLIDALPELSKIGSKDDMSVACLFDETRLKSSIPGLVKWQRNNVKEQIESIDKRISSLSDKKRAIDEKQVKTQKDWIDLDYFKKELERASATKQTLISKFDKFSKELDSEVFVPYSEDSQINASEEIAEDEEQETLQPPETEE